MRIDIYHHFVQGNEALTLLKTIQSLITEKVMPLIDDLQAKADALLVSVQKNSDVDDSILEVVTGQAQTIRDLKTALDAAGTDPAKLAALGATMDQLAAKVDADSQKVADAVTANTKVG